MNRNGSISDQVRSGGTRTPEHLHPATPQNPCAATPVRRVQGAGQPALASGLMRSILLCDDRAEVRLELAKILRGGSPDPVHVLALPDGSALLDAYNATVNHLVLIGIHSGTSVGIEATNLLLEMHPAAAPIVFGSIADIDLLSAAYAHGCTGLMLWETGKGLPHNPVP